MLNTIANASMRDFGQTLAGLVFNVARPFAMAQLRQEVGARAATMDALAEKAYEQIGGTEITATIGSDFSNQARSNLQILAELYERHPWIKICTSYIAEALGGIPLRTFKAVGFEDGKEVLEGADDSPIGRMFRWINPHQSQTDFITDLASWLILTGEAYVVLLDRGPLTPTGVQKEMYVLLSTHVEKITSEAFGVVGYIYNITGERVFFDTSEVIYMKTFSPTGRFRGQGTAAAGIQTIATDEALREFNRNILTQGVHLSGILETDNEDLKKDDAEVIRQSFVDKYSGVKNTAKIAVLWSGLKFSPQTILQKDIMMSEQQEAARNEIIAMFGLKPELFTEKFSNRATAETVRRMAYEDVILGRWGQRILSGFNGTGLARFDPDIRLKWDTREVDALQASFSEKIKAGSDAVKGGLMTINEGRGEFLAMPPIDGIEGDVIFIDGIPAANRLTAGLDSQDSPDEAPKGTGLSNLIVGADRAFGTTDLKLLDTTFSRTRAAADARTERAIRSVLRDLQQEVRKQASRSTVRSEILTSIEQVFLINGRKVMAENVSAALKTSIDAALEAQTATLAQAAAVGVFDVRPVRALGRLSNQEQRIRKMMGREWADLRTSLGEGLAVGETQAELTSRTSKFFNGMRNNAATIARTEVNASVNAATTDVAIAARKAGVDVVSIWSTAQDELVRRPPQSKFNHAQAHGLTLIPGEEMFVVSGQSLEYPGDSWNGASAGNTINCRCGVRNEVRKPRESDVRGDL